jgi:hypothetical protein
MLPTFSAAVVREKLWVVFPWEPEASKYELMEFGKDFYVGETRYDEIVVGQ